MPEDAAQELSATLNGGRGLQSATQVRPLRLFQYVSPEKEAAQRIASPLREVEPLVRQKEDDLQPPPTQILPLSSQGDDCLVETSIPPMPEPEELLQARSQQQQSALTRTLENLTTRIADSQQAASPRGNVGFADSQHPASHREPVLHRRISRENLSPALFASPICEHRKTPLLAQESPRFFAPDASAVVAPDARETTARNRSASKELCVTQIPVSSEVQRLTEKNDYLRKNVCHLRSAKHALENRIRDLERRNKFLEQEMEKHKVLFQRDFRSLQAGGCEVEIQNLHDQLEAVMQIKQALNTENLELQRRLEAKHDKDSKQATCVVCMDNLANTVCMPCKHLAICMDCAQEKTLVLCPICRKPITDRMQIYCP